MPTSFGIGQPVRRTEDYRFLTGGATETARDVFALNTRLFPESGNVWDSLAEAYMNLGEHDEAIRHYEKSLALAPNNTNATAMIAKMREEAAASEE